MSVVDTGHSRTAFLPQSIMFSQALQSAFSISHKVDTRQDSNSSSVNSKASVDSSGHADTPARSSSSSALAFLTRGSSRPKATEEVQELAYDIAIRPSFCWNSHQEAWQSGVWSQFDSGLKSCQDDAYACTNFMGRSDAAFAGVFDGHGFNGRSAATYASKNMTRWLGVDGNAASKDPKRRLKALESVCAQIERGLARQELCGFDSSASGLATCCALLQGNRLCVATIGPCKAVLGRPDSNSATRLKAVDLSQPDHASRVPSDTTLRRLSPSIMFAKTSMPLVGALSLRKDHVSGQGFLGRGLSGEPCTVQPVMTMHQLSSLDHFVVVATSGLWEVMTPQEVVDFVHQCRQCRPDSLSCSAALTMEAHMRWKLRFAKVIAEDVGAVVLHYGAVPKATQPYRDLPAFPQAATSNHEANDDGLLHETREFWARLQPESLVPLLQTESSKGKGVMPAHFFPNRTSPSLSIPIKRSSPFQSTAQPHNYTPFQGFAAHPSHSTGTSETKDISQHSREGSQHSREGSHHSTEGSNHSRTGSRDSNRSAGSKNVSSSGRSVRFDLPSSPDESSHGLGYKSLTSEVTKKGEWVVADGRVQSQAHNSSPVPIAFRPDTPDMALDVPGHLSPSSSHSSMLSGSPSNPPTLKAASPPTAQESLHKPHSAPSPPHPTFRQGKHAQQQQLTQPPNPFAAVAMQAQSSSSDLDLSLEEAAASNSRADASMLQRSPKSMRTHVQHPLEESELQWEVANAAAPITPRVRLSMERAHSAGLWSRRRPIGSIPEDRPLASSPPKGADETAPRPIRKIYPQGSGDLADLLASPPPQMPLAPSSLPLSTAQPQQLPLSSSMHTNPNPTPILSQSAPRRVTAHLSLPKAFFPEDEADPSSDPSITLNPSMGPWGHAAELEGRVRGGFLKVSSHPELAAIAESAPTLATPFAAYAASYSVSPQDAKNLYGSTVASDSAFSSINPWSTSELSSTLGIQKSSNRSSALGSVHGSRSRNNSAALNEILKLRFSGEGYFQPAASISM